MDKAFEYQIEWITLKDNSYTPETQTKGLLVVIACSSCGGAGSGMAFKLAAQIKHFYKGLNPRIVGIFLGSSIFNNEPDIQDNEEMRKRNDFEFLMQLQKYSLARETYRVNQEGKVVQCPIFDVAFYIDQSSNHPDVQRPFNSRYEAFHASAEMISHLVLSGVGSKLFSNWSNHQSEFQSRFPEKPSRLGDTFVPNQPRTYSSFGLETRRISSEEILNYLAKGITLWVVQRLVGALDQPVPRQEIICAAMTLSERLQLTPEGILNALGRDVKMPEISPTQFFDRSGQVVGESVIANIRQFIVRQHILSHKGLYLLRYATKSIYETTHPCA